MHVIEDTRSLTPTLRTLVYTHVSALYGTIHVDMESALQYMYHIDCDSFATPNPAIQSGAWQT
jgi:hypothetical protein